ncbi:MAG: M61 family peptidase [Myxococcales bacterium]|nr:M61 family peptidase [Myxococcales bacterium]
MSVQYRVGLADRAAHRFSVAVSLPAGVGAVTFPSWAPGSYLMREFARFVRDVHAHRDGAPVAVRRLSRNRWGVEGPCTLQYQVYAREKSVRTAFLDEELAFFLPSNLLVYVDGQEQASLTVEVPAGHVAVCPLGPGQAGAGRGGAGEEVTFETDSLDVLMDSPVAVGHFDGHHFDAGGVPHEFWILAGHNGDPARMAHDLRRIVLAASAIFGDGFPYPNYQFVTLHQRSGHGGLEHKNNSVLLRPRLGFVDARGYEEFLTLAAHEHFHAWNVKRIHPEELGPHFDYANEHYTRELWWLEGGTVYYEERIVLAAGVVTPDRHLERLADLVHRLRSQPGRRHQSLEDSSFDAWIKLYRPSEDAINSTISYYLKGAVVLLCLDLELRHRSGGARSLDDLTRALWQGWGRHGRGFPLGTIERLACELAGGKGEFSRWYAAHVRGTDEVDVERALDHAGLDLIAGTARSGGWLGVELSGLSVSAVREDGPAAGVLSPGDELIGLDGERLDAAGMVERLRDVAPGTMVRVSYARDGRLREGALRLGAALPGELKIVRREHTSEARATVRRGWLDVPDEKALRPHHA